MSEEDHGPNWWAYLVRHKEDIHSCVEKWGEAGDPELFNQLVAGEHTPDNAQKVDSLLNRMWFNAPDRRDVYAVPGFTEACNLLDLTVHG